MAAAIARARSARSDQTLGAEQSLLFPDAPAPPSSPVIGQLSALGAGIRGLPPSPPMEMTQRRAQWREDHGVDTAESECRDWVSRGDEEGPGESGASGECGGSRGGVWTRGRSERVGPSGMFAEARACAFVHMYLASVCRRRACLCTGRALPAHVGRPDRAWHSGAQGVRDRPARRAAASVESTGRGPNPSRQSFRAGAPRNGAAVCELTLRGVPTIRRLEGKTTNALST